MITSSGPRCDVCGEYILPFLDKSVNPFCITGIEGTLLCHDKCKLVVLEAMEKKDWKLLPDGPIRQCFSDHAKELGDEK
jgi:hypothetical protein